jgi:hypothetical protein
MRREYLEIGSSPAEEPCAQAGFPGYTEQALRECRAFKNQLLRQFGEPPDGASISVKHHITGGGYYEVVVYYDDTKKDAIDYAFRVEAESPAEWDEEAKKELGKFLKAND